ncbi:hypothetical protein POM88_020156 [Heracleum sosnowskyi]|uniref:Uncharacterized protein n=1 Tax=Heracleum sosnowskyi TaxID=360622 RepID=A0AAD8ICA6_9APIA|nr:hypothetical protein POM88_020156 [Heracleum sosnowskyi]
MEEAFAAIQIEDEVYGGLSYENDNEDLKPKRRSHTMGSKWLRNGGSSQGHFSGDGGKSEGDKGNPVNGAQGKQNNDNLGANLLVINKGDLAGDIGGKIEGINQKGSQQIHIQNSKFLLEANEFGPDSTDLIIVDPKRRRVGLDLENNTNITQEQDTEMETQYNNTMESKNELMAGAALQSRQSL